MQRHFFLNFLKSHNQTLLLNSQLLLNAKEVIGLFSDIVTHIARVHYDQIVFEIICCLHEF
jgi:hypothetical protein